MPCGGISFWALHILSFIFLASLIERTLIVSCEYVVGGKLLTLNIYNKTGNVFAWDGDYDKSWFSSVSTLNNYVHALAFDPMRRFLIAGGEFDLPYGDYLSGTVTYVRGLAVMEIPGNAWHSLDDLSVGQTCADKNCPSLPAVYSLTMHSDSSQLTLYVGGFFQISVAVKIGDITTSQRISTGNVAKCIFDGREWSWSVSTVTPGTDGPVMVSRQPLQSRITRHNPIGIQLGNILLLAQPC
jgi:hypothetical protein